MMLSFERICEIAADHDTEKIAGQVSFARAIEAEVLRITGNGRGEVRTLGANTGHGHVFPRPDGVKYRCGGPALCHECASDLAAKMQKEGTPSQQEQAARVQKLEQELAITQTLLQNREQLLNAIPECHAHGKGCVPHALEWIEKAKAMIAAAPKVG